jgi:hypothetical protein
MQFGKARLAWTTAMVIVAAVITTLAATGHVLDAVMMTLLAVVLIGAYTTRKYARAALLYNRLADGRSRRPRTNHESSPDRDRSHERR